MQTSLISQLHRQVVVLDSAGAVATNGEIVISMDKMNQILEFFPADRMVRVQAGVVTEQLQNYAEEQGMYYPVDFASAGSSQIGGNIGTNAGGIKVIKYGMTRNWVLGLTVVTGKGDILRLNKGMIKMQLVMHYSICLLVVKVH